MSRNEFPFIIPGINRVINGCTGETLFPNLPRGPFLHVSEVPLADYLDVIAISAVLLDTPSDDVHTLLVEDRSLTELSDTISGIFKPQFINDAGTSVLKLVRVD